MIHTSMGPKKFRLQWNWKYLIFGKHNFEYTTQSDKRDGKSRNIQRRHKNGNWKIAHVDFASVIWLESDLSDNTYLQG